MKNNKVIKKIMGYIVGLLLGFVIVGTIKSALDYGEEARLYKENHIYGRLNAEQQTIYITGVLHGEAVKMTASLQNTMPDSFARTGMIDGNIGDEKIIYTFSVGDTEEGDVISEKHGLYYAVPTYDDEWLTDKIEIALNQQFIEIALNQQFIGACGGNSSNDVWLEGLPMTNTDKPVHALYYDVQFTSDDDISELTEKFPAIHAFLSDNDLKETVCVRIYTEYDEKKTFRDQRIILIEIELHARHYGEELDGETKLQFAF